MKLTRNKAPGFLSKALGVAMAVGLSLTFFAGTASAVTGAGATILNVATVDYQDVGLTGSFSATAAATVTVDLISAAPTLTVSADQTIASGLTATYTYYLTNNSSGAEDFTVTNGAITPFQLTGESATAPPTPITLGASYILSNTAATINIPAGSGAGLGVGDILVIGGADYRIAAGGIVGDIPPSHTNGSGPNTVAGVTTNETEITITLESNPDPLDGTPPAAPSFVVNALVGVQVGERASFTVDVTGTVAATFSQGTATLTTTATSTAVPASTANVTTITTFLDNFIQITKVVTNTTSGAGPAANVPGVTGDILEYTITMTNTSAADAVNVVLTDDEPPYTSYVGSSTTLNAGAVADGGVDPLPTATANGGLAVNDAGSAPGTIAAGTTATVTFQVQIQ